MDLWSAKVNSLLCCSVFTGFKRLFRVRLQQQYSNEVCTRYSWLCFVFKYHNDHNFVWMISTKIMMILRVWDNGLLIITMLIEIIILLALLQYWLLTQHLTWICEATLRWSPLLNNVWPLILRSEMRISFLVQRPLSDDPTTIILTRSQH